MLIHLDANVIVVRHDLERTLLSYQMPVVMIKGIGFSGALTGLRFNECYDQEI